MDYLKYYFLEDCLFSDMNATFRDRGYLTPEECFAILIRKANRAGLFRPCAETRTRRNNGREL